LSSDPTRWLPILHRRRAPPARASAGLAGPQHRPRQHERDL